MIALYPQELRAILRSGAGDDVTVQLHWQQQRGDLGLAISSTGFDEGRYLSPLDMIHVGSVLQTLALYALREGGGS